MTLEPGKTYQSEMTQTLTLRGEDTAKELAAIATLNIDNCFELNEQQWNAQIASLLSGNSKYLKDNKYRKVLVKAMMTLNSNYRTLPVTSCMAAATRRTTDSSTASGRGTPGRLLRATYISTRR